MNESKKSGRLVCGNRDDLGQDTGPLYCPNAEQSHEDVAAWLRDHGSPGEPVVVLLKHQGLCQYRFDEISARRGSRVHLREHGAFDARGLASKRPRNVTLRILKPSAAVVRAADAGLTLQQCRPVNKRPLGPRERSLAQRIRGATSPDGSEG